MENKLALGLTTWGQRARKYLWIPPMVPATPNFYNFEQIHVILKKWEVDVL